MQTRVLRALARAFPETTVVLDHVGGPLGLGAAGVAPAARKAAWQQEEADKKAAIEAERRAKYGDSDDEDDDSDSD